MNRSNLTQLVNGILLLNKPSGKTSNAVLQEVKRLFKAKKAGHTGSLDPLATGMLPIFFGEATKFCQYLLDADKCYEATGLFGIKTNTADAEGEVIEQIFNYNITQPQLENVLNQYKGLIKQVPSMFSALKHKGKPLYKYAREGQEIERSPREVTIQHLQLIAFSGKTFDIDILCSKGTYIRNLVEDIGSNLGVGAHVVKLHRKYSAGFQEETMYTLSELQEKSNEELLSCLLPIERAVNNFPALYITMEEAKALRHGKVLTYESKELSGCVRLYAENNFIGLGALSNTGVLAAKRLLAVIS